MIFHNVASATTPYTGPSLRGASFTGFTSESSTFDYGNHRNFGNSPDLLYSMLSH